MPVMRFILAVLALGGVLAAGVAVAEPVADPLESFNRAMFSFNRGVVTQVINPSVEVIGPRLPRPVATGLSNAYSNLTEVEFILNNLMVGAPVPAAASVGRFAVNSTVGVLGVFDVASEFGLKRRELDFTESLCQTGIPPGPYLVLPLVGPANAYSAGTLATAVAIEVYALSFISSTLAMADFFIIDLGGSAAALRHVNDLPAGGDPYKAQRDEHLDAVKKGCRQTFAAAKPKPAPNLKIRRAEAYARPIGDAIPVRAIR